MSSSGMLFVDPCNDLAFKKIFSAPGSEVALRSLLNAILGLIGERLIVSLTIGNPYQPPIIKGLRDSALDVHVTDGRGVRYIVEMQVENVEAYTKRILYYSAKSYVGQIKRAEDYPLLNQVVFIGILDFRMFEGEEFLTRHLILNEKTHRQELPDLEFNFIELPKFRKTEKDLSGLLDDWMWYFKKARRAAKIPSRALRDPGLRQAWEQANAHAWSKEEMETYDYWAMRDTGTRLNQEKVTKLESDVQKLSENFETERRQKERLADKLREMGIDPDTL